MLNVVMLSVIMLSVVMLSVVMLSVVKLSVMEPGSEPSLEGTPQVLHSGRLQPCSQLLHQLGSAREALPPSREALLPA
jgi:hypothetical protein